MDDFDDDTLVLQYAPRTPTPSLAWVWLTCVAVMHYSFKLGFWLGGLL